MNRQAIRAHHIFNYIGLSALWAFCLFGLYITIQNPGEWPVLLTYLIFMTALTAWYASLCLIVDETGFTYQSGFRKRQHLRWDEISSIRAGGYISGYSYYFISGNSARKPLEISYFYFRPRDMASVIQQAVEMNPSVYLDDAAAKIVARHMMGKSRS